MIACRVMGHRMRFSAEAETMTWWCARDCGVTGEKVYHSAEQAARYAAAFDHEDSADLGKRAPLIGLLPLRLWRMLTRRR